jgi:hypothetical protein
MRSTYVPVAVINCFCSRGGGQEMSAVEAEFCGTSSRIPTVKAEVLYEYDNKHRAHPGKSGTAERRLMPSKPWFYFQVGIVLRVRCTFSSRSVRYQVSSLLSGGLKPEPEPPLPTLCLTAPPCAA